MFLLKSKNFTSSLGLFLIPLLSYVTHSAHFICALRHFLEVTEVTSLTGFAQEGLRSCCYLSEQPSNMATGTLQVQVWNEHQRAFELWRSKINPRMGAIEIHLLQKPLRTELSRTL